MRDHDGIGPGPQATDDADVLQFWFGEPATSGDEYRQKIKRWFMGGPALDAEIRDKFGTLVERAIAGELDDWAATPRGRLALILLLDQFTRSVYRDDAKTYAGDAKAQRLTCEGLDQGLDRGLTIDERNMFVMPLVHAENLAMQERGVVEMAKLVEEAPAWQAEVLRMGIEQTTKYRAIIARFGRFPHRNQLLGRASTPEEQAFLVDWEHKKRPQGAAEL